MALYPRLLDLLLLWEEARDAGRALTPEELCRDCPELLPELERHVAAVRRMNWMTVPVPASGAKPDVVAALWDVDALATSNPADTAELPVAPPPALGRYRLEALLGQGGYGQVWRAYDPELQRYVAVKLPRQGQRASPAQAERFLAEARRVAGLRHPGIVPVYDVGREGDLCYLVAPLVEGTTLAESLAAGVPFATAAALVAEVAEHLHHAHEQGFVHRDLKPANILVDVAGRPYLTDFGIAVTQADRSAGPVEPAGTLAYMAPELLQDEDRAADVRTDVYALGVILYEALTGQRPFTSRDPTELRAAILAGNPLLPHVLNRAVPARLECVCLKALAMDPARRHGSAAAFAEELRTALVGRRVRPGLAVLVVLLALAAVVSALAWGRGPERAREPEAVNDQPTPTPGAATPSPTGAPPVVLLPKDQLGPTSQALVPTPADAAAPLKPALHLVGHGSTVVSVAFMPDGRRALSASTDDHSVRLWDLGTGALLRTYSCPDCPQLHAALVAPDGRHFLHGSRGRVLLRDLDSGAEVRSFDPVAGDERLYLALSSSGRYLAAGDDTAVTLWDFASGRQLWQDGENFRGQARALAFDPDQAHLLVGNRVGPALLYRVEDGHRLLRLPASGAVRGAAFLPDGRFAVTAGDDSRCHLWDTQPPDGKYLRSFAGHTKSIRRVAASPNGRRLLSGGEDGAVYLWDVATGRLLARGHHDGGRAVWAVAFSPNGRQALSAGTKGLVLLWTLPE